VAQIRSGFGQPGYSLTGATDVQIATAATDICANRAQGNTQAQVISYLSTSWHLNPKRVVRAAEQDVCPKYGPKPPVVLIRLSGNGIENSPPVVVNSGTLTVKYSYDCSSAGGSGNFIADLQTPDQASLSSDDQSIANALGAGGSATTTIYPQDVGSKYYLAVNSECNWSVTVTSP
jgi:hypothetical protein